MEIKDIKCKCGKNLDFDLIKDVLDAEHAKYKECQICYKYKLLNEFETLPCGDKFCLECIKFMFKEWYTAKKALSSFLCLTGNEKCKEFILED